MTTLPRTGVTIPNTTGTDQVPADLQTVLAALEQYMCPKYATAAARDVAIPSPGGGDRCWLISPGKYTYYDATLAAWADEMNPTAWGSWTPTLQSTGGTAFTLGTGSSQIGRFRLIGKSVQFQAQWNFGSSVVGPGGQLVFALPPGLPSANVAGLQQTGTCALWVPTTARWYQGMWIIDPNATKAQPWFEIDANPGMGNLKDTSDGSTAGTGIPLITGTSFNYPIQVNGSLNASGIYQIA